MGKEGAKFVKQEFNWEKVTRNFLDIVKPSFIGMIDKRDGVWAVMLDDVLSGILTALIITVIYLLT